MLQSFICQTDTSQSNREIYENTSHFWGPDSEIKKSDLSYKKVLASISSNTTMTKGKEVDWGNLRDLLFKMFKDYVATN